MMNTKALTKAVTTPYTEKLVQSVLRLLRPVARLALGRMTGTLLLDLMRRVLVEEACNKLRRDNSGKVTLSEVALLTGIDSRMVKQLINTPPSCTEVDLCREAMVLHRWARDEAYQDPVTRRPVDLLMFGTGVTFQSLVSRVAGRNVTVQTVLERLLKNGNVEIIDSHWLRLVSTSYQLIEGEEELVLENSSVAMQNLGCTILHNLHAREDNLQPWMQQQCLAGMVPATRLAEFRQRLENLLREQIAHANHAIETETAGYDNSAGTHLVGVGYYYWEADTDTCNVETDWSLPVRPRAMNPQAL